MSCFLNSLLNAKHKYGNKNTVKKWKFKYLKINAFTVFSLHTLGNNYLCMAVMKYFHTQSHHRISVMTLSLTHVHIKHLMTCTSNFCHIPWHVFLQLNIQHWLLDESEGILKTITLSNLDMLNMQIHVTSINNFIYKLRKGVKYTCMHNGDSFIEWR